ncbi:uncharacterized protein K02A2.6-like [Sycon ciliatum]|uniref:uncharacterized protein K02A2.6-like n=1 Tax=Sycon ciliatum TaxID=27933 RepID=UPI0031F715F3
MLAVVFGLTKFRQYALGRTVDVLTDHKPLVHIVKKSFDEVPPRLQRWLFFMMRSQLTVANGILLLESRVVIPSALQQPVLKLAHEGHPGSATFKDTLRRSVWWPRMSRDAEQFAAACDICWRSRTNHSQELQPTEVVPVWHKVAVDLVEIEGRHLLSLVDYGSRFPELIVLPGTKSQHVVMALSTIFARFGIPLELVSDNGPQFV